MTTLTDPATGVFIITPSDTDNLAHTTRAIRSVGAGVINLVGADGVTTPCNFAAGETRPIRAKKVLVASTTVVGAIEGMY